MEDGSIHPSCKYKQYTETLREQVEHFSYAEITIGIILNLLFVFIVLKKTDIIEKMLGQGGVNVLRRVFGIILLALAIKLFKVGLN